MSGEHDHGHRAPAPQHGAGDQHDFTGPLSPGVASLLKWFGSCCVVLFVLDFIVEREHHAPKEEIPGFYPVYGFVGCVLLVLVAKELRKIVMRPESYYDDGTPRPHPRVRELVHDDFEDEEH